jgi:hypothetical protein
MCPFGLFAMPRSDGTAKSKLLEALEKLHRQIAQAFEQEPDCPRNPANERERYVAALNSIAQYFTSLVGRPIGERFFELASAIADLNVGTVHPLLRPVRPDNRPADPSQLWRARARVVLGLEALLRFGLNRSDAAAKIARDYSSIAKLAGANARTSNLQTTLFGWRKRLLLGRIKNFEAQELFSAGLETIAALPQDQHLAEFAERQLSEATELLGALSSPA